MATLIRKLCSPRTYVILISSKSKLIERVSDVESRFFSAVVKKFPFAKLRLEIAIIKPLFVECRRTARRKWKVFKSLRIKLRHFYGVFLVTYVRSCVKFNLIYFLHACGSLQPRRLSILSRVMDNHYFNGNYCYIIRNWSRWFSITVCSKNAVANHRHLL